MWGPHFILLGAHLNTMGMFTALAFAIAILIFYRESIRLGVTDKQFLFLMSAVAITPLGATLLSVIEFGYPLIDVVRGKAGSSHLGGVIVFVPTLIFIARRLRLPVLRLLDVAMLSWCLGYSIGRLACFFGGDGCYGIPTSSWLGMPFPHGIIPTLVPVYPAPLFESIYSLVIFITFYSLYARRTRVPSSAGRIFFGAGSWMFLCRFAVEYIRLNPKYEGLSLAQWICMPLIISFSAANVFLKPIGFIQLNRS